ncbi:hypothetical protein FQZ97_1017470 [compost metagenome]
MSLRNHLLETGAQFEARDGHVAQQHRDQQDADHERQAVVEHHTLQQVAAARIEVIEILDNWHHAFFHATHVGFASLLFLFARGQGPLTQTAGADQQ